MGLLTISLYWPFAYDYFNASVLLLMMNCVITLSNLDLDVGTFESGL